MFEVCGRAKVGIKKPLTKNQHQLAGYDICASPGSGFCS